MELQRNKWEYTSQIQSKKGSTELNLQVLIILHQMDQSDISLCLQQEIMTSVLFRITFQSLALRPFFLNLLSHTWSHHCTVSLFLFKLYLINLFFHAGIFHFLNLFWFNYFALINFQSFLVTQAVSIALKNT